MASTMHKGKSTKARSAAIAPRLPMDLTTADPTDAGTGASMNEVATSNGYARTAIALSAAASRTVVQDGAGTVPQVPEAWGTVTHWVLAIGP